MQVRVLPGAPPHLPEQTQGFHHTTDNVARRINHRSCVFPRLPLFSRAVRGKIRGNDSFFHTTSALAGGIPCRSSPWPRSLRNCRHLHRHSCRSEGSARAEERPASAPTWGDRCAGVHPGTRSACGRSARDGVCGAGPAPVPGAGGEVTRLDGARRCPRAVIDRKPPRARNCSRTPANRRSPAPSCSNPCLPCS